MEFPHKFVFAALLACLGGSALAHAVSLCCEKGRYLDFGLFKCVAPTEELVTEAYKEQPDATDPSIQCKYGWANFTMDTQQAGAIVEPKFKQTLQVSEYCVHTVEENENNNTIIQCLPKPLQVNKCCPIGYAVNRKSIGECVPTEKVFNASLYVQPPSLPMTVKPNVSLTCDYDYNIFVPKMFVDHRFSIIDTGELFVESTSYNIFRYSTAYCIDSASKQSGDDESIALTCLPRRMYIVRWILRVIYPFTQLFSASLLLATLLVYLSFPALRDNLQGKAMICFLISLFAVQLEYGILLTLPSEPHTWCSIKKHAAIYFRCAAATWITVMGFLIWRHLKTLKRPKKSNEWIEFFLLSIYAWGLPLIWSFFVKSYMHSPEGAQVCLIYNSTVKLLMQTPNILVTLNLISFIPNVIKVYDSLSFLRISVSPLEMSRIEKQRLATIFRFFLLMQLCAIHYTLPSIVGEIFDFNATGPELVFYIVSFTQFIGPAMFYSFVCKPDVLGMISNAVDGESLKRLKMHRIVLIAGILQRRHQSYSTSEQELRIETGCYKTLSEDSSNLSATSSSSSNI